MSDCGRNRNLRAGTGGSGKAKNDAGTDGKEIDGRSRGATADSGDPAVSELGDAPVQVGEKGVVESAEDLVLEFVAVDAPGISEAAVSAPTNADRALRAGWAG